MTCRLLVSSLALAALAVPLRAQTRALVVHPTVPPGLLGVDYNQISDAVVGAQGSEVVLVNGGDYVPFTVDKPLSIVAEPGESVGVNGTIVVEDLPAGKFVHLRGLHNTSAFPDQPGLIVRNCAGVVWLEDCSFTGDPGQAIHGVDVRDSEHVVFVRSQLKGPFGTYSIPQLGATGGPGLFTTSSTVAAWDVTMTGGAGVGPEVGGPGGAGARLGHAGRLLAFGGTLQGGGGGWSSGDFDVFCNCFTCNNDPGPGGPGLSVAPAPGGAAALLRGVSLIGGPGGQDDEPECASLHGPDGPPLDDPSGLAVQLAGAPHSLLISSPVREGESQQATITGTPGDGVLVLGSTLPGFNELSSGVLQTGLGFIAVIGTLPPSGTMSFSYVVPELGSNIEALPFVAQPLFVPAGGGKILGAPSLSVLVDGSIANVF